MLDPVTCIGCSSCVMIGQSIIGYDFLHDSGKTSLSNEEDINLLTNELFLIIIMKLFYCRKLENE